jgi:uncharacterized protein
MLLEELAEKALISPPGFVRSNTQYLTVMGSIAYGVSTDTSDYDCYGFCIPPRSMVFPHLRGEIQGFGTQIQRFENWQKHHVKDPNALGGRGREYDFAVYSIVQFFHLCLQNNPNIIDSLFVPQECVLFATRVGQMVREKRHRFLHKGCWHRFKGYAYSQMKKAKSQTREGKRAQMVQEHGYDLKFAYHIVRLLNEVEQLLTEGDLDLRRNREQLKSIRRGDWTLEQIEKYFASKEAQLEKVYAECKILPYSPQKDGVEEEIHTLLLQCLEEHYGSIDGAVVSEAAAIQSLRRIQQEAENTLRSFGG